MKPATMADDALTRKEEEMDRLMRLSEKATRGHWANRAIVLVDADIEFAGALVDWFRSNIPALRALSLESVREEALEEAAKVCDAYTCDHPGGMIVAGAIGRAIRELQHAPARVADGGVRCPDGLLCLRDYDRQRSTQQALNTPAPESPAKEQPGEQERAEMVKRLTELQSAWLPGIGECFPITFTPAERTALIEKLGQGWILKPRELQLLIDYHDAKGCEAEAMDVDGSARYHDKRRAHYESLLPPPPERP